MEVDVHSAGSSVDSRHSSPFQLAGNGSASASTSPYAGQLPNRKRQRSVQSFTGHLGPASEYLDTESFAAEREEDGERAGPAKRRNVSHLDRQTSTNHQYAALGSAYDSGGILFEGDYSFDSPMHSLSLASPSPPGDIEARSGHTDVDMVERENSATASNQAKTSTNFLPRQLKHTSLIRSGLASTVPLNPSPLYHSERFLSSSTGSKSSGGNPSSSPSTEEPTPRKDVSPMHSDQQSSNSNSPASSQTPTNRIRPQYTIKIKDSPLQYTRTPSPSPLPSSPSATHEDERKLHYSPGLSQTAFPGGKHMLRYTMGYRDDCVSCQNKTAGHYGHVLHR